MNVLVIIVKTIVDIQILLVLQHAAIPTEFEYLLGHNMPITGNISHTRNAKVMR